MNALLIIGMQVDFLPLGAVELHGSGDLVPVINEAMAKFDLVVAANFSHPTDHKMFVANYPWRRPGQVIDLMGDKILLRNYYCINGTFGAELGMEVNQSRIDYHVEMGTNKLLLPHSAFFDENKKRDTGLSAYFQKKDISKLTIAGLPLESAVKNSAIDALDLGFKVYLFPSAVLASEGVEKKEIISSLKAKGVHIIGSLADNS